MPKEKPKRGFFDLFDFDKEDFFKPKSFSGGGSGYSISVTYDEKGKPVVKVQTHGDVNVVELRKEIEQRYPDARIEGLERKPLIRIVDEEPAEPKGTKKEPKEPKDEKKGKKISLIRIVE